MPEVPFHLGGFKNIMLSLSLVKSAKCYGHLGGDGGARTHTHTHVRVDLLSAVKTT